MGHFSPEAWRPEGLGGLSMTLMRNGFLPLNLREYSRERLKRARLLIAVAPAKPYTAAEREMIYEFVSQGGVFLTMVGYEERGPSEKLLEDLGFSIGLPRISPREPPPEPRPLTPL